MVKEVGELELVDGLLERKLQEPYYSVNGLKIVGRMPWLPLYRV
jgi:hypothetical protein